MRGIGPCYRDKVGRSLAVRLGDMYRDDFHDRIQRIAEAKRRLLAGLAVARTWRSTPTRSTDSIRAMPSGSNPTWPTRRPTCSTRSRRTRGSSSRGPKGRLLDIDHGTFPFVTSSNSSGVGVSSGSGVPGRYVTEVIGIIKAYTTRVGGGPFPTEQDNETGQHIRDRGNEYGTVTRRPRRCGWFDAVAARYTARLSGVDVLAVMLLDVLSELPELKICTAYELDGQRITDFPSHVDDLRRVRAGLRDAARLAAGDHRRPPDGRPAGRRKRLPRPHQPAGRPARGHRLGRPRSPADDSCGK